MRNYIFLFLALFIFSCNEAPKKKTTETVVEKEVLIPDSLLGKDLEGNAILVGKISYAQMEKFG